MDNTVCSIRFLELWSNIAQPALIRWKFVTHCFTDGKSRLVPAVRVSTNNRGATVLDLFLEGVRQYGLPSRVRGDHGVENLALAGAMEEMRGQGRGSYIFGRWVVLDSLSAEAYYGILQECPQHPHRTTLGRLCHSRCWKVA